MQIFYIIPLPTFQEKHMVEVIKVGILPRIKTDGYILPTTMAY